MLTRLLLLTGLLGISLFAATSFAPESQAKPGGEPFGGDRGDFFVDRGHGLEHGDSLDYVLTGFRRTTIPVSERYWSSGAPAGATSDAIARGVLDWNAVTPNFRYSLTTSTGAPASHVCGATYGFTGGTDGVNSIVWVPFPAGAAIGVACWNTGTDECDVALDSNWAATANSEAIRTVLLHEMGHCAGLGHSTVVEAVMYYAYFNPKILTADDIAGICALYTCGIVPTPTPTTNPPTMTPTRTPTATPTPKGCARNPNALPHCRFLPFVSRD